MNKIKIKNQFWLLLKKEVEDYVSSNQNYFLDHLSMIKLLALVFFAFFFI